MEYLRDRLVRESIRFMEICQLYYFNEKISLDDYRSMTEAKKSFINNIMKTENSSVFMNKEIKSRLEKIYGNDDFIYGFKGEAVGK